MNKINISHVNNMHNQWLRTLTFYKTEFAIQKGLLTEIAGKYTGADVLKEVEHLENQFKIQSDNIDKISHEIHGNISQIAQQAHQSTAGYIDDVLVKEHTNLGVKTDDQTKLSAELVKEFRRFAEKTM